MVPEQPLLLFGMKVILVSLLFFGVAWAQELNCDCGWKNEWRIDPYSEAPAPKNVYPWTVAIRPSMRTSTFCTGAIITPRHVITAAHCVKDRKTEDLLLITGAFDVHSISDHDKKYIKVAQIRVHSSYDSTTGANDIAILLTESKIKFTRFIGPVCMPNELFDMIGQGVKAMGWKSNENGASKKLEEVSLRTISHETCQNSTSPKMCATPLEGSDACMGDTGGPMIWEDLQNHRYSLIGIVTTIPENCKSSTEPVVVTNVSSYVRWINIEIKATRVRENTCHKTCSGLNC